MIKTSLPHLPIWLQSYTSAASQPTLWPLLVLLSSEHGKNNKVSSSEVEHSHAVGLFKLLSPDQVHLLFCSTTRLPLSLFSMKASKNSRSTCVTACCLKGSFVLRMDFSLLCSLFPPHTNHCIVPLIYLELLNRPPDQ